MSEPNTSPEIQRSTYRLRRIADAARLLPLLGAALFILPLLWDGILTSKAIYYIFGAWVFLALIAGLISRYLGSEDDRPPPDQELDI